MRTKTMRIALLAPVLLAMAALITGCDSSYSYSQKVVRAGESQLTTSNGSGLDQETHDVAADAKISRNGETAVLEELEIGDSVNVTTEEREGREVATEIKAISKEKLDEGLSAPLSEPEQNAPLDEAYPAEPADADPEPPAELSPPLGTNSPAAEPQEGAPEPAADAAEETFEGKISMLGDDQFAVIDGEGDAFAFVVNDETQYTLDGKEASYDDLAMDYDVIVVAEQDVGLFIAKKVEATTP